MGFASTKKGEMLRIEFPSQRAFVRI